MTDVFISYARADRNRVRPIALALAAEGFSVWWDPEIKPGAQWNAAIRKALENAACVLTCWSKKSAKSQWVVAETTHGAGRKVLVPVTIQLCEPPIPFNMTQSADLSSWRGDGADPEWQGVLEQVRRLVEAKRRLAAAPPPPGEAYGAPRAPEAPVAGAEEPFAYTPSPRRFGPRLAQMLLGGAVVSLVLTAGVFLAPVVNDAWKSDRHPDPASPETEAGPAAPIDAVPDPGLAQKDPALPPSPQSPQSPPSPLSPPAPSQAPYSDQSLQQTAPQAPVAPAPTGPSTQRPSAAGPAAELDACANRLSVLCPGGAGGAAAGFRADGRLSAAETDFLNALQIFVSPPTQEAVAACQSVLQRRASGASTTNRRTVFDQACATLAAPPASPSPAPAALPGANPREPPAGQTTPARTPTAPAATPREPPAAAPPPSAVTAIIEALPQILGRSRETERQTTARSGSAIMRLGAFLDLGSGEVGETGDLGLTAPYRRVTAQTTPLLQGSEGVGLAAIGGAASQAVCARAAYGAQPLPVDERSDVCVRRRNGTFAAVTITDSNANSVAVRYQIWE
jgi:hypothetical protein